jgi:hypothetical protein
MVSQLHNVYHDTRAIGVRRVFDHVLEVYQEEVELCGGKENLVVEQRPWVRLEKTAARCWAKIKDPDNTDSCSCAGDFPCIDCGGCESGSGRSMEDIDFE